MEYHEGLRRQQLNKSRVDYVSTRQEIMNIYKQRYGEKSVAKRGTPLWRSELNRDLADAMPNEPHLRRNFTGGRENKATSPELQAKLENFARQQAMNEEGSAGNAYARSIAPPPGGYRISFTGSLTINGYEGQNRNFTVLLNESAAEMLANDPGQMDIILEIYMADQGEAEYESGNFVLS